MRAKKEAHLLLAVIDAAMHGRDYNPIIHHPFTLGI